MVVLGLWIGACTTSHEGGDPSEPDPGVGGDPTPCGTTVCAGDELCVRRGGGVDSGTGTPLFWEHCEPEPRGCRLGDCVLEECCTAAPCVRRVARRARDR